MFAAGPVLVVPSLPVRSERCGEVVSIRCSTTSMYSDFVTSPYWLGPGGQTVDCDETLDGGLIFSREYTCEACVDVLLDALFCGTTAVRVSFEGVCVCVCVGGWMDVGVCMYGCMCMCVCSLLLGNPSFKDPCLLAQVV